MTRIVVVLGYSNGRSEGLHPICAARLERAVREADGSKVVLLSGWARKPDALAEAELMRRAWPGDSSRVVCDADTRTTAENAARAAALAGELGAEEIVVVTSRWHRPRAALLFRAIAGKSARVRVVGAPGPAPWRVLARELGAYALVPLQISRSRRARAAEPRRRAPSARPRA
jgi:uncharacterized SAM-binding protein YcdF (DUF218 family)